MFDSIDSLKLRHDISQLIADCIHLKSVLRTTWLRPMAEEQRRLIRVRRNLTERFVLLAVTRKKLHVTHVEDAIAYHQTIAMRLLPEYARSSEANEARV